jgi:hypothetical protein
MKSYFVIMWSKKTKNPAQKLSSEDIEILEKVVIKYVVKYYGLLERYRNPKNFAKKIVKEMLSDNNVAALHIIGFLKNSPEG